MKKYRVKPAFWCLIIILLNIAWLLMFLKITISNGSTNIWCVNMLSLIAVIITDIKLYNKCPTSLYMGKIILSLVTACVLYLPFDVIIIGVMVNVLIAINFTWTLYCRNIIDSYK